MCGIAGIYDFRSRRTGDGMQITIDRMTDTLLHRGPDSRGTWSDVESGIALGHRRLAIRDLSPAGHQPMLSSCGRFVIVYNGEVYSHAEIGRDLAHRGRALRGSSDTEVILEACAEWGVARTVDRLIGMFAFALLDRGTREITLARDRLGIKPLYWGMLGDLFLFGSELKAIRAADGWEPKLDRNALSAFMRHNYVPAPHSIYQEVHKLEPGTLLKLGPDKKPQLTRYWDLRSVVQRGRTAADLPEAAALEQLDTLLCDAVKRRMVADVPLGALLSGGVDSSLVTALMAEQSDRPINTFAIGFEERGFDEAPYARQIAMHLGTTHTELYVASQHVLGMVEKLPYWYDEPFADSSQLPTALVCELTRKHVTVALTGDGGDELFAGYSRYTHTLAQWKSHTSNMSPSRQLLANVANSSSAKTLSALLRLLPTGLGLSGIGRRWSEFANRVASNDPAVLYRQVLSHWHEPDTIVIDGQEPKGTLWDPTIPTVVPDFLDRMQFLDTMTYLPDDILTKVDRASMSVALEARVPLLDHRVVEFAWQLPQHMKLREGQTKWALRQILYRRVPRNLIERPKMGFGVPLDQWLRGPLRSWADHLLGETRLKQQGLFNPDPIRARWRAHLDGTNWGYPLWNVLMAQAWIDSNPTVAL